MSPYAITWLVVDAAALIPVAALLARHDLDASELRLLVAAQLLVVASAIVAALTPLNAYAEWTLMVAVNLGYALVSRRRGAAARSLATIAILLTTLSIALVLMKTFISIIVIAVGLVFAVGALLAAIFHLGQTRVTA